VISDGGGECLEFLAGPHGQCETAGHEPLWYHSPPYARLGSQLMGFRKRICGCTAHRCFLLGLAITQLEKYNVCCSIVPFGIPQLPKIASTCFIIVWLARFIRLEPCFRWFSVGEFRVLPKSAHKVPGIIKIPRSPLPMSCM